MAVVDRQRSNLMRRAATFDDDELAAPFLVEINALGNQRKHLQVELDRLFAELESWELAQTRRHDLQWWCIVQAE